MSQWQKKRISEVADVFNGKTPSKIEQRKDGKPVLKIKDVDAGGKFKGIFDSFVDEKLALKYKSKIVNESDILILNAAHSASHVGSKIYFAEKVVEGSLATGEWTVVRTRKDSCANFVFHYFKTDLLKSQIKDVVKGIHLYPGDVAGLEIPFPTFSIQQKIARILDKADALRQKDKQLLTKYDELAQSIFYDMFGDPIKNQKGWEIKTIEQLVSRERYSLKRGPFGGALKKEIFVPSGYLVYEQFHALNNDFSFARYFIDETKFKALKAFEVKPGDIIISCSGVYLGKLAIIPSGAPKGIMNQALLKISIDEQILDKRFFVFVFSNENFKRKFYGDAAGSGIPNFPSMDEFKKFEFIYPPRPLQAKFAAIMVNIDQQKQQAKQQVLRSEELFQSLLQKAFNEELVK